MKHKNTTSIGSQELYIYAQNDKKLHDKRMAIARALAVKKARRQYVPMLGRKAFRLHLGKPAAQQYCKEFGKGKWNQCFTPHDLHDFAQIYEEWFSAEYKLGNFESILPAKYQSRATRKKVAAAMAVADAQRSHSIGDFPDSGHVTEGGHRPSGAVKVKRKKSASTRRGARRGGRVPSGAVKPHRGSKRCVKCGRIHTAPEHWSHETAPKGGARGGYKKRRAMSQRKRGGK